MHIPIYYELCLSEPISCPPVLVHMASSYCTPQLPPDEFSWRGQGLAMASKIEQRAPHVTHGHLGNKKKHKILNETYESTHILLFHGPKFFWRERVTVENHLYLHPAYKVVELVSFHTESGNEVRLYFDYEKVISKLDEIDIDAKMEEKKEELRRKKKPDMNSENLRTFALRALLTAYIELRICVAYKRIAVTPEKAVRGQVECERCKRCIKCLRCKASILKAKEEALIAEQEKYDKDAEHKGKIGQVTVGISPVSVDEIVDFMCTKPDSLVPVRVEHRKKANAEEFKNTLNDLKVSTKRLNSANDTALTLAGLAKSSVEGFKASMNRMFVDPLTMTRAQLRWKKAIKKIILQNAVANYTEQWERSMINPKNSHTYDMGNISDTGSSASSDGEGKCALRSLPKLSNNTTLKSFSKFPNSRRLQSRSFAYGDRESSLPPVPEASTYNSSQKRNSFDPETSKFFINSIDVNSQLQKSLGPNFVSSKIGNLEEFVAPRPKSRLVVNPVDISSARKRYSRQSFIQDANDFEFDKDVNMASQKNVARATF